jgi:hypothetical protein
VSGPVLLVPESASHEVVKVLHGLCELAKTGEVNGLVFGVSMKGQKFYCDSAGALHRNPVMALGVVGMLHAKIEHGMRQSSVDTVI